MVAGVADLIAAPPLRPPVTGLLNSAQVIDFDASEPLGADGRPRDDFTPVRWEGGLRFPPEICPTIEIFALGCGTGATLVSGGTHPAGVDYEPFVVVARDECSTYGWQAADYRGRAERALAVVETIGVEFEFWTGTQVGANNHLASTDATTLNSGTAYALHAGLAALVRAIADARIGQGMIHAPVDLVELWFGNGYLWRDSSNRLYTANGHLVVAGDGYTGSAPDGTGATPTATWAYATDLVQVLRGPAAVFPDTLAQATKKDTNIVDFRAERPFAVQWNGCLHAAAKINTTT